MRSFIVTYEFMGTDYRKFKSTFCVDTEEINPTKVRNFIVDEMNKDLGKTDCICSSVENIWEIK